MKKVLPQTRYIAMLSLGLFTSLSLISVYLYASVWVSVPLYGYYLHSFLMFCVYAIAFYVMYSAYIAYGKTKDFKTFTLALAFCILGFVFLVHASSYILSDEALLFSEEIFEITEHYGLFLGQLVLLIGLILPLKKLEPGVYRNKGSILGGTFVVFSILLMFLTWFPTFAEHVEYTVDFITGLSLGLSFVLVGTLLWEYYRRPSVLLIYLILGFSVLVNASTIPFIYTQWNALWWYFHLILVLGFTIVLLGIKKMKKESIELPVFTRSASYFNISIKFLFLALSLYLTVVVVATFYFTQAKDKELQAIIEFEKGEINGLATVLEQKLNSYVSDVQVMQSLPSIQGITRALESDDLIDPEMGLTLDEWVTHLEIAFSGFISVNPYYAQLRYIDSDGYELVRVDTAENGPNLIRGNKLQNKSERYYFQEAKLMQAGETYVSPIDLNVENDQVSFPYQPIVRYAQVVQNASGNFAGMVILNVDVDDFLDLVRVDFSGAEISTDKDQSLALIDQDGYYFINSSDPIKEFGRRLETDYVSSYYEEQKQLIHSAPLTSNLEFDVHSEHNEESVTGLFVHRVIHYNPSNKNRFLVLIANLSEEKVFGATIDNFKKQIVAVSFVFFIIFLLAYVLVVSPMVHRVTRNVLAVRRVAQGDLTTKIEISGTDEISEVSLGINEMITQLEIREKDSLEEKKKSVRRAEDQEKINTQLNQMKRATLNILEDLDAEKTQIETKIEERTFELKREKEKLAVVAERMVAGTILLDGHGQVLFINATMLKILEVDEYKPTTVMPIFFKKFSDQEVKKMLITCTLDSSSDEIPEIDINGRVYSLVVRSVLLDKHDKNHLANTIIFIRDITDEKLLERSKSELVAVASHQLRTPLTAMRGNVEMLVDESYGALNSEQKELLNDVEISTVRLIEMVNDMLDITKIEAKTLELNLTDVAVCEVVDSIISDLAEYAQRHQFTILHSTVKEKITVYADALRVRQVLQNLIDNAIKYSSHPGSLSISYVVNSDSVVMTLTDDGIGIPKAEHSKLFGRFYRASNTSRVSSSGSGLGLYIVKSIVESLQGSISFESEENEGTTFIVTFPRHDTKDGSKT